jgi:hypothetical protein
MNRKERICTTWLLGLTLFVGSVIGFAREAWANTKTYPATFCVAESTTLGTLQYELDGSLSNTSPTDPLEVICPVVRDNTQTEGKWSAKVYAFAKNPGVGIECTATSRDHFGDVVDEDDDDAAFSAGVQTMSMFLLEQAHEGYSTIRCTIPEVAQVAGAPIMASKLTMYSVTEPGNKESDTDSKSYPGVFAFSQGGILDTLEPQPFVLYESDGSATRAYPDAEGLEMWTFPLIRDRVAGPVDRVRMRVLDNSESMDFGCFVTNFDEFGEVGLGSMVVGNDGTGEMTTDFGVIGDDWAADGPILIQCLTTPTPGAASLFMVDIQESG